MIEIRQFLALIVLLIGSHCVRAEPVVHVAIIIDDLGNNLSAGNAFIELPAPLTLAILPHTAHSKSIAIAAHAAQKEIIVHLPMANLGNSPLGPGGLTAALPRADFLHALDAAISDVPFAKGINNHTGSYLTQQSEQMSWLMHDMHQRDFFFVDSRTTPKSVAHAIAETFQVFSSSRDIFLDNERTQASIDAAFKKMITKAKQQGTAIAIGHPYPETLQYLQAALPTLEQQGVRVLPVSSLIALQHMQAKAMAAIAENKPVAIESTAEQ